MTTIAFRDGILAADSMVSYGSFRNGNVEKLHRVGDKIVGMSGAVWAVGVMLEWIEEGADSTQIPEVLLANQAQFSCIFIDANGTLWEFNNGFFLEVCAPYHAIGSGQLLALGAMASGASACEAVNAAAQHDKATGGEIVYLSVADLSTPEAA